MLVVCLVLCCVFAPSVSLSSPTLCKRSGDDRSCHQQIKGPTVSSPSSPLRLMVALLPGHGVTEDQG